MKSAATPEDKFSLTSLDFGFLILPATATRSDLYRNRADNQNGKLHATDPVRGNPGRDPLLLIRPKSSFSPTQIFEEGTTEEKGENARLAAFVGAIAVGDLVKSTLGPKGMDKILQSA